MAREIDFYNLDMIISVDYRVNSQKATQFRIWATKTLKEFITKGFLLDDERLKNGGRFGKDYFDELLEHIREIRTSEQRFYQKITDIDTQFRSQVSGDRQVSLNLARSEFVEHALRQFADKQSALVIGAKAKDNVAMTG